MPILTLPGLIDPHVHLREPGAVQKEDFLSGSRAALRGGFTFVLDMPNNPVPTLTLDRLEEKIKLAEKAIIAIGFHFGTNGTNTEEFEKIWDHPRIFGLKVYCNHTTGELLVHDHTALENIFVAWKSEKPILVHAEGEQLAMSLELARVHKKRLHVCHISQASEVTMVREAKALGQQVSAGVTPHHLFLTEKDRERLGSFAIMKPPLGTEEDQSALWEGLRSGVIDMVESDHAPHTREEKTKEPAPFGVPGLETTLPLLITAVREQKMGMGMLEKILYTNAQRIFTIPKQEDTFVEVDTEMSATVGEGGFESRCGWSPWEGERLFGMVKKVVLRGKVLLENGAIV